MIVYPAMDLMGGRCVRLAQGRFEDATVYPADPAEALAGFATAGTRWAHVVDLDGARTGTPAQHDLLVRLAADSPVALQVAGGFRDRDSIGRMLEAGVGRVVIGSLAVRDPAATQALFDTFGADRVVLAIDVRIDGGRPMVAVAGWGDTSPLTLWDVAGRYPAARHILVTDIGRDGMMRGPNLDLTARIVARLPEVRLQASGGVARLSDLTDLAAAGAAGAVVGKALWEGRFGLEEAIAHAGA